MKNQILYFLLSLSFFCGCATKTKLIPQNIDCMTDPQIYDLRSKELQSLVSADQMKRTAKEIDWSTLEVEDLIRRKRVAEIFAEGCFKAAADYSAAALIFQHGKTPDHFVQAFHWAKKSVELGDKNQQRLMIPALDRYLVNIGHKQLFATQATKSAPDACWCLEPVEPAFPQSLKLKYSGKTLNEEIDWLKSLNKDQSSCAKVVYCAKELKPTTKKMSFGLWE